MINNHKHELRKRPTFDETLKQTITSNIKTRLVERLAAVEGKRNHITRTSTDIARPPRLPRSLSQPMIQQNAFYMVFAGQIPKKKYFA